MGFRCCLHNILSTFPSSKNDRWTRSFRVHGLGYNYYCWHFTSCQQIYLRPIQNCIQFIFTGLCTVINLSFYLLPKIICSFPITLLLDRKFFQRFPCSQIVLNYWLAVKHLFFLSHTSTTGNFRYQFFEPS